MAWLLQAQDLIVPTLADNRQGVVPNGQLLVARSAALARFADEDVVAVGYPLVLFTIGALVLPVAYLDRDPHRTGRAGLGQRSCPLWSAVIRHARPDTPPPTYLPG